MNLSDVTDRPSFAAQVRSSPAVAAILLFLLTAIVVKLFAVACIYARFHRSLEVRDLLAMFAADALLTLIALAVVAEARHLLAVTSRARRIIISVIELVVVAAIAWSIAVYVLSGYVFWEWGAFLESHHLQAVKRARIPDEVLVFLLSPKGLATLAVIAAIFAGGLLLHRVLRSPAGGGLFKILVVAAVVLALPFPLKLTSKGLDPSTISPIVEFFSPGHILTDGLPEFIAEPPAGSFAYRERGGEVPEAYKPFAGVGRDKDLIIVILESTRLQNVSAYGYARDTTPTLKKLAAESIVFHNAYSNQPRSCKAMESLTLGVYPDPRLRCMTWDLNRFDSKVPNLTGILKESGYSLYFGSAYDEQGDRFAPYLQELSGGLSRVVGPGELSGDPNNTSDVVLVSDYLKWKSGHPEKSAAILWFTGAHYPYNAFQDRFPVDDDVDKYDNCIYSADFALSKLLTGLARQQKLDDSLFVIFGDHGEMLGEHMERLHGSFLYEEALRIPFLVYWPQLGKRVDARPRFQLKDVPATLFYLLGIDRELRQSSNAFALPETTPVYLSNVFHDFKLGMIDEENRKFIWRARADLLYAWDLDSPQGEDRNIVETIGAAERIKKQNEMLGWYFYQLEYLGREFPFR